VKIFNWNDDKNEKLKAERGVSFEQIVFCIENDCLLDIIEHPNKKKYKGQKMYVVKIDEYVYIVPSVEKNSERFLITVFPSRKYSKLYIEQENKDG